MGMESRIVSACHCCLQQPRAISFSLARAVSLSLARLTLSLSLARFPLPLSRSIALSLPLLRARGADACEIPDVILNGQRLDCKFATLQYVVRVCVRARLLSRSLFSPLTC